MNLLELFVLSAALGTDLFSVAIPIGMNRVRFNVIMRAAFVFAIFHIGMILAGYYAGRWLGQMVEHLSAQNTQYSFAVMMNWPSVLAGLVLIGLGAYMIKESLSSTCEVDEKGHPLQGGALFLLALSVSVDALAAGFSLGMMEVDLMLLSLILGIVIFVIAVAGLGLGRRLGCYIGERSEQLGGGVLILLGIHVLWKTLL